MTGEDKHRFWSWVKPEFGIDSCWIWMGSVRTWNRHPWSGGYGAFWINGKVYRAHRIAYELIYGKKIPKNKVLLHRCDSRRCVNVLFHIYLGTQEENMKDMKRKGRAKKNKKERIDCPRCGRSVATKHWAPGYPGLHTHNDKNGKKCSVGYVRPSKTGTGWTV